MKNLRCRLCSEDLKTTFVDLGYSPLANAYLEAKDLTAPEVYYPLHAYICRRCWLAQLPVAVPSERIFSRYAYFSSYSDSWLSHASAFAQEAAKRWGLNRDSLVVEVASNDGYLLQYFRRQGMAVLGIEPAINVARVARSRGIKTLTEFFGRRTASKLTARGIRADLLIANNVLAHVPDLLGFLAGLKALLRPLGVLVIEFPHLLKLLALNQFDTIYHEHLSYFSLSTLQEAFSRCGLRVFEVAELATHGGSLRVTACHAADKTKPQTASVARIRESETRSGIRSLETYVSFATRVVEVKRRLLEFLLRAKARGQSVVAYGAAAKGTTLLNTCGIRRDLLAYVADISPHKQGRFLPGVHIPIYSPKILRRTRPDYVLILPWNLEEEIRSQLSFVRRWGGRFVIPIPRIRVCP